MTKNKKNKKNTRKYLVLLALLVCCFSFIFYTETTLAAEVSESLEQVDDNILDEICQWLYGRTFTSNNNTVLEQKLSNIDSLSLAIYDRTFIDIPEFIIYKLFGSVYENSLGAFVRNGINGLQLALAVIGVLICFCELFKFFLKSANQLY